jgi:hypothetical protein
LSHYFRTTLIIMNPLICLIYLVNSNTCLAFRSRISRDWNLSNALTTGTTTHWLSAKCSSCCGAFVFVTAFGMLNRYTMRQNWYHMPSTILLSSISLWPPYSEYISRTCSSGRECRLKGRIKLIEGVSDLNTEHWRFLSLWCLNPTRKLVEKILNLKKKKFFYKNLLSKIWK